MNLQPGKLYSMLDLLGARYVCDECCTESKADLTPMQAKEGALRDGWRIPAPDGRDLCPTCCEAIAARL